MKMIFSSDLHGEQRLYNQLYGLALGYAESGNDTVKAYALFMLLLTLGVGVVCLVIDIFIPQKSLGAISGVFMSTNSESKRFSISCLIRMVGNDLELIMNIKMPIIQNHFSASYSAY
jgi:hypothetical protein